MSRDKNDLEYISVPTIEIRYRDSETPVYLVEIHGLGKSYTMHFHNSLIGASICYATGIVKYIVLTILYRPVSYIWLARPVGYLLNKREREEWFGDLLEIQDQMINEDRYPIPVINLIIAIKTLCLLGSKVSSVFTEIVSKVIG